MARGAEARRGVEMLQETWSLLPADAVRDDGGCDEASALWRLSAARSVASRGPVAAEDGALALCPRAAEKLEDLARADPDRDAVDVMRFGIVRAGAATAVSAMVLEGEEPSAPVTDLEARLLGDLQRDGARLSADETAVRAYDERPGEGVTQSVDALAPWPSSRANWATAARAATVFEDGAAAAVAEGAALLERFEGAAA